ncbi:lipase [Shewanella gelidimarina]|uniref:esterase/lipase family protein n=1 Tax=Shewanella gelidimarina TaxID=56813 RepID=UPI00200F96D4|nr:alpha/beta fold hydrolase [Shewanella gelidimarina]MCL1057249.1 lipase [Shewanella gelidimarina]
MKIVLVHGIFNTGHVMRWMQQQFTRAGHECFSPTIAPFDGRLGIEHAAANLKRQIEQEFGLAEEIVVIGFSMGGIVARYYLQLLGGATRVRQFFSLSVPHAGSIWAYLPYPSKGVKQLRPKSELLNELRATEHILENVELYSYRTPIDFTIVPNSSSIWPVAENKSFWIVLHLTVIFSHKIVAEINRNLASQGGDGD